MCGSCQAWSKAQGLGPCLLGVRGFKSHLPHFSKNYKYPKLTTVVKKTIVGITVVGRDKEGIVASFTNFAFQQKGNIEKVNQNVIKGLFGMYLEISFSKKIDVNKFNKELRKLGQKQKMEVTAHHEINSKKNIAVFVTKEEHCLKEILSAYSKHSIRGKLCVIVGTEKSLSTLAKMVGLTK